MWENFPDCSGLLTQFMNSSWFTSVGVNLPTKHRTCNQSYRREEPAALAMTKQNGNYQKRQWRSVMGGLISSYGYSRYNFQDNERASKFEHIISFNKDS
jgi:hypothetical protein